MKENSVLGVVAEYNPFHNGHVYHLEKAKESQKRSIRFVLQVVTLFKEEILQLLINGKKLRWLF